MNTLLSHLQSSSLILVGAAEFRWSEYMVTALRVIKKKKYKDIFLEVKLQYLNCFKDIVFR